MHYSRKVTFFLFVLIIGLVPPTNEVWGKVIFLHLSVILFTGGYLGRYTPRQVHTPPWADTSLWAGTPPGKVHTPLGRYTPRQVHPTGRYTPQVGTPPGRYTPQQCMLGYGQQAGGTHPTGMHSCLFNFLRTPILFAVPLIPQLCSSQVICPGWMLLFIFFVN